MPNRGPLKNVRAWAGRYVGTCPGCGLRARMDGEQFRGEVSVDCPECEYHETHDHREEQESRDAD